uniref:Uncharacterized protein n=1 Tax=Megaselia scalaris TaxID=36166 RepID=T1GM95_MEGSC
MLAGISSIVCKIINSIIKREVYWNTENTCHTGLFIIETCCVYSGVGAAKVYLPDDSFSP